MATSLTDKWTFEEWLQMKAMIEPMIRAHLEIWDQADEAAIRVMELRQLTMAASVWSDDEETIDLVGAATQAQLREVLRLVERMRSTISRSSRLCLQIGQAVVYNGR
ncbi:hypothetical protein CC1G_09396 [Coprinopsis cinerea okayama7|uniref:Uncharacterized protein n=1 Tax=Coprinopsis cinerea (strain Okayama-7 / 130 / ATCC MYA-4618 / FGSC 9003) TaxID=240176 RepID=A8NB36_COPC7|nr:hypothetical protein CC1G_09396 [Coprinopsis cinerea okayama7\|eukprot:XP_001832038.2 hypothetical protein CC1G_09396 [Coprinopsis cinerea okayama7\